MHYVPDVASLAQGLCVPQVWWGPSMAAGPAGDGLRAFRHETSITAGTLFEKTHKPLRVWFKAMWLATSQKTGASALGLQRVLGLGSYETAWLWLHKLRP